ncbi:hypothetical protein DXK93_26455 [Achromobacter sp. K91]|uniref:Uncharacterized protein n=1 Tax=Achromobacter aegrifaciens TaxID=1287736 RepID=A0AAD2KLX2_ACHAE|nr:MULTISPECIES: hypothetical protein [Achromobacter]MBD9383934.1 hypothetical protein [Achromobacter sp. ACM02]RIJ00396.1 hypothetical protein DXK93_26455 [Achromobacter sp. K91]CUJ73841.1 Uncharacterised protein [Achromobacter aegrifaciens]
MSTVRTYFQNRLPAGELARLMRVQEPFFLENIVDIDETAAALQALCREHGLTVRTVKQPYNASVSGWDLASFLPAWFGALALGFFAATTPGGQRTDVTLKLRSNSLLEVCFSRPAPHPGAALP